MLQSKAFYSGLPIPNQKGINILSDGSIIGSVRWRVDDYSSVTYTIEPDIYATNPGYYYEMTEPSGGWVRRTYSGSQVTVTKDLTGITSWGVGEKIDYINAGRYAVIHFKSIEFSE